jgi:hypothetical protein
MPISALLHLECVPVEPVDAMKHVVFSCPQSQGANLERLPAIASQRFAVMYDDVMGDHLIEMLERAHSSAALTPVKLIAVREHDLHVFLDATVASATLPAIARLWESVVAADLEWPWSVSFALETELGTGHSDFELWDEAKEILESYPLGIGSFDLTGHDSAEPSIHANKKWTLPFIVSKHFPEKNGGGVCRDMTYPYHNQALLPCAKARAWFDKSCFDGPRLLSNTEMMALGEAVHSSSSLRDTCLRAMFMSNARTVEIKSIKVEDVSISDSVVTLRINSSKSHKSMHRFLVPAITPELLWRYVQEYHLSPEDYLFPSAIDASRPLSTQEVKVVFDRWLRDAQIEREHLTPSSIRSTFARPSHSLTLQRLAEMMGHVSQPKTLDYISLFHLHQNQ